MEVQFEEADCFFSLLSNETLEDSGPEINTLPGLTDLEPHLYEFEDIGHSLMTDPFLSPSCAFRNHRLHTTTDCTDSHLPGSQPLHHLPYPPHGLELSRPIDQPVPVTTFNSVVYPSIGLPVHRTWESGYQPDLSCAEVTSTITDHPCPKGYGHQPEDSDSTDTTDSSDEELYSPRTREKACIGSRPRGRRPRYLGYSSSRCSVSSVKYPESCRPDEVKTPIQFKSEDERKDFNNARERGRIRWQNEGFQRLKELLPSSYSNGRRSMTKGQILHNAADLVIDLMNKVEHKGGIQDYGYQRNSTSGIKLENSNTDRKGCAKALNDYMIPTQCPNCRHLATERGESSCFADTMLESA